MKKIQPPFQSADEKRKKKRKRRRLDLHFFFFFTFVKVSTDFCLVNASVHKGEKKKNRTFFCPDVSIGHFYILQVIIKREAGDGEAKDVGSVLYSESNAQLSKKKTKV